MQFRKTQNNKQNNFDVKRILSYAKYTFVISVLGVYAIFLFNVKNTYLTFGIATGSFLVGIAFAILIGIKEEKRRKEKIINFSTKLYNTYYKAISIVDTINQNEEPFTQIELEKLIPALNELNNLELQIHSESVQPDIIEKLENIIDRLLSAEKQRANRIANKTGTRSKYTNTSNHHTNRSNNESFNTEHTLYFKGCTDLESVKRRYKKLCQVYHPDTGNGDADTFHQIAEQYKEEIMKYE